MIELLLSQVMYHVLPLSSLSINYGCAITSSMFGLRILHKSRYINIDVAICGSMAVNVAHNAAQTKLKEVVMHWLFQIQECVTALDC